MLNIAQIVDEQEVGPPIYPWQGKRVIYPAQIRAAAEPIYLVAAVRMRALALVDDCYPDAHTRDAWARAQWKYSANVHMISPTNPVYIYTVEESRNVT